MYLPFPSGSATMGGLAHTWGLGLHMIVEELNLRRFMVLTAMGSGQSSMEQAGERLWTLPLAWRAFVIGQSWMVSCHLWLHRSLTHCWPGSSSRAHWGELLTTEKPWPHIRSRGFVASARYKVLSQWACVLWWAPPGARLQPTDLLLGTSFFSVSTDAVGQY